MHILIPLKRLDDAKSRLSETMSPAERGELMLSMLAGTRPPPGRVGAGPGLAGDVGA